ncbi:SEL1-like repeat protein [Colwellia piezophila]|uniref:nSTAND1 domain-containing NTPase n=1 Tax=Colwellia piezophila TaxID=211668 RepID=UPI000363178B|nr:SEL1-like repeat protein [Colwellia piezophila]
MIYILTNTTTVLQTEVRPQESQIGDPSVKAQLNLTLKRKLTPQSFQDQQRYLNSSAIAAYVSLNKLDQRQRFRAGINLTTQNDDSFNFSQGSSSSGLGYALALFESWWRVVLKKPGKFEFPIFATGEILTSGHVLPISHICEKIDSVCAYVEKNQDRFTQFSICYPIQNDDDITKEQRKKIADLGGVLLTVTRLQNLIGELLDDSYDGDPLGRWAPFKGLSSFDYEDSVRFFGRSKDVNRLYEDLKQNQGLLIVSGASGTGKSSLIKAGLIPKLEQVSNQFSWAYTTPSKVPENIGIIGFLLEELNKAWQLEQKGLSITELILTFASSPRKAIETISTIVDDKTPPCLIYFDQFEEVFSQPNENIVSTLKALNDLANQLKPLDIVLAIRNEYLGRLLDNQALSSPVISNVASQLELDDWQAIIHEQSAFSGITFEHDSEGGVLDKVIIDEASKTPFALPMVEFLLEQLYLKATLENPNATELKYQHYQELGGLTGAIAYRATQVLKDNKANEKLIAQLFDAFVGLNGEFLPYAKHVDLNKLEVDSPQLYKLAQQFIDANLIVSANNTSADTMIKLVHDSLFNNWNELKEWVTKNKDYLEWRYSVDGQFLRWCSEQKNNYLIKDNRLLKEGWRYFKSGIISDNHLAKYLKLSKQHKTNTRLRISFIFIVLPIFLSSFYYWDLNRVKSYYFANIAERWSVPFGLYELNEEEKKHLGKYYRLDYQRGVLKKLSYQNSIGTLIKNKEKDNAALWEYKYAADGNLFSVDIKTSSRKRIRLDNYRFAKNQSQVFIGKSYLHINPFDIWKNLKEFKVEVAGISQYKYFYNESGFITKKYYLNAYGKRISDDDHTGFGEKFTYTHSGQISTQLFLDQNGQPIKSSVSGTVEYKQDEKGFNIKKTHVLENASDTEVREYDIWGNNTEIMQTNEGGQLTVSSDKPARIVLEYDSSGNKIGKLTYNKKGYPTENTDGYGREVFEYDIHGRPSKFDGFERDIKLKNNVLDGWKNTYTMTLLWGGMGNIIELTNEEYGPTSKDSYYKVKFLYDKNGDLIQRTTLDRSGDFLSVHGNYSYVKYKYTDLGDDLRAIIEQAAFDPCDKAALDPCDKAALYNDYYHRLVLSYDDVDLINSRSYFGVNGEPVANKDGFWKSIYEYDENNRLKSIRHYYPNKSLKVVLNYDVVSGDLEDTSEAITWYTKAATQGDAKAQFHLAHIYDDVNSGFKDRAAAMTWYKKSAVQGSANAQFNLALIYHDVNGGFKDTLEAIYWYKKSAEQGNADAQYNLATIYNDVNGGFKDKSKAMTWYKKSAEQGDAKAQHNLAIIYNDVNGGFKDKSKAMTWYKKSAEQGDAYTQFLLARIYDDVNGGFKDTLEAIYWYKKSAEQGNADAQFFLALIYGDVNGDFKDTSIAMTWYKKSAEQGYSDAQFNLALIYDDVNGGFKDTSAAMYWYKKAAEQGDFGAQFLLAYIYDVNEGFKDTSKAIYWYKNSAEQGYVDAQFNLALIYDDVNGGFKDTSKAIHWYKKAAEQGHSDAQFNLSLILKNQNQN